MTDQSGMPTVSADRHVAGIAFEPTSKRASGKAVKLSEPEIKAVFNVLWYFGRAMRCMYLCVRWYGQTTSPVLSDSCSTRSPQPSKRGRGTSGTHGSTSTDGKLTQQTP